MDEIFQQMPMVFPWYKRLQDQNVNKENSNDEVLYKLITPPSNFLPFQIQMNAEVEEKPNKWEIFRLVDGSPEFAYDITPSLSKIKLYKFDDRNVAVYNGEKLSMVYDVAPRPLNMYCGYYYSKITFPSGLFYVSEIFYVDTDFSNHMQIMFYCDNDLKPIVYRNGFKQILYLSTFVHTASPEVEEETLKDGNNNENPVWQKMVIKYKFIETVPDFLKIALISLQIHEFVYLWISETRQGFMNRVFVTETPDDSGAMSDCEVTFEDDILIRNACPKLDNIISLETW